MSKIVYIQNWKGWPAGRAEHLHREFIRPHYDKHNSVSLVVDCADPPDENFLELLAEVHFLRYEYESNKDLFVISPNAPWRGEYFHQRLCDFKDEGEDAELLLMKSQLENSFGPLVDWNVSHVAQRVSAGHADGLIHVRKREEGLWYVSLSVKGFTTSRSSLKFSQVPRALSACKSAMTCSLTILDQPGDAE